MNELTSRPLDFCSSYPSFLAEGRRRRYQMNPDESSDDQFCCVHGPRGKEPRGDHPDREKRCCEKDCNRQHHRLSKDGHKPTKSDV
eukprot:Skav209525  [mRNA]  locus=scaffold2767:357777:358109:- [translate_table: standard]